MDNEVFPELTFLDRDVALLRIALALAAGGLIGMDREWRNKPAGLRTHAVVAVASALAMMIGFVMQATTDTGGNIPYGVLAGIGFLGGGAILRYGRSVRGLVTGATIWSAAVVGLGFGLGWYFATGVTTAFIVVSLFLLQHLENLLNPSQNVFSIRTVIEPGTPFPKEYLRELPEMKFEIRGVEYDPGFGADHGCICFEVRSPSNLSAEVLKSIIGAEEWAREVEILDGHGACGTECGASDEEERAPAETQLLT